jgi:hypothetical protein
MRLEGKVAIVTRGWKGLLGIARGIRFFLKARNEAAFTGR